MSRPTLERSMARPAAGSRPLHHIGYWVADLAEATARFARELGVGPFLVHPHIRFDSFDLHLPGGAGREVVFDHSAAFTAWGSVVLELSQVHAIDDDLAAAYGVAPGEVGHVSWLVDDLAAETQRLQGLGCTRINGARIGPVTVEWLSGGPLFNHPIEVHLGVEALRGMHSRLLGLAASWDGSDDTLLHPMRP